ncbi:MAG: KpsF/GutQ family sugar-phosphate isomerase, partial [Pirellulaceae bacterium]
NSGETRDIVNLVPFMKRHHVPVVSITGSSTNSLAQVSDCHLATCVDAEADSITDAPTNSTTATLALCDGLAVALVHLRGFTAEQFAMFHPSGQLGRQLLLRVSDLMATGDAVPLVPESSTLREAIVIISQKTLGAGFVVNSEGKLLGIVTDGDLRRILEQHQNPLDQKVDQLMTRQPRTVTADQLAVEALNRMNDFSITMMPVVDEQNHISGALHIHQLLKAGF